MTRPYARERGFTLVEIMVTLTITGILLALVGTILTAFLDTQRKVEATLLRERVGSAILDLLARDVQGAYTYNLQGVFKGTDEGGTAQASDRFELVTTRDPAVRESDDEEEQESEAARRRAAAFGGDEAAQQDQALLRDPPVLTQVAYLVRTSRAHPQLLTLFRSEKRFIPPPPPAAAGTTGAGLAAAGGQPDTSTQQEVAATERFMEVYDRVKSFNVRYLFEDKEQNVREWRDAWDDPEKVPAAIEVTLEIVPDPRAAAQGFGQDRPQKIYRTVIAVPVTQPKAAQPATGATGTAGGTTPK